MYIILFLSADNDKDKDTQKKIKCKKIVVQDKKLIGTRYQIDKTKLEIDKEEDDENSNIKHILLH